MTLPADLLARLALALRAALNGERPEATLLSLTQEFVRAARDEGMSPEGAVLAFKQALGPPPPRPFEGRYQRIREQLIAQCIGAYFAPTARPAERAPLLSAEDRYYAAVVDDDRVIVALVRYILAPAFEVAVFEDARSALASFYERRPDLVVLDVHLPDYSGSTLLGVLRSDARLRGVPAVAVTGDDDPAIEQRLRGLGFAAFFRKPLLDPDAMLAAAVRLAEETASRPRAAQALRDLPR